MTQQVISQIEALDAERSKATLGRDAATLGRLMGDDLLYVHGSAVAEGKALYIERVCSGFYDYKALTNIKREFRVLGDVVLVNGDVRIQVVVPSGAKDFVSRYLQVWARRNGNWQMVSWQSTPLPAA